MDEGVEVSAPRLERLTLLGVVGVAGIHMRGARAGLHVVHELRNCAGGNPHALHARRHGAPEIMPRVVTRQKPRVSQTGDDLLRFVFERPAPRPAASMFHGGPFTFTHHRGPGTVDEQMDAGAREDTTQRQIESLRPPRQCGVIGRGQVEAQHPEDRPQKDLRLAEGQVKEQAERQRGFDGNLGVLQLSSTLADATASHVAIASGVNHRVTSPRWTSARSYAGQFPMRYFVLYLGCTLDFTSRSCSFGRHDGQAATNIRFRAPTPLPRSNSDCADEPQGIKSASGSSQAKSGTQQGQWGQRKPDLDPTLRRHAGRHADRDVPLG